MITDQGIHEGTGYSSRVKFELEILSNFFEKPVLIYPEGKALSREFNKLCLPMPITIDKPIAFQQEKVNEQLSTIIKKHGKPKIIYGQNLFATFSALKFAKQNSIPIIFDYHGVVPYEIFGMNNIPLGYIKKIIAKFIEKKTIKKANLIVTVSNNFVRYINRKNDSTILPMLPSDLFINKYNNEVQDKDNLYIQLNISKESIVFCYLGQAQFWQLPDETLNFYKHIEEVYKDTHLLVITKDKVNFEKKIRDKKIINSTVISAKHDDVPRYLSICDYGFALRNPSIINQVSSPTKVLEYVSQGVKPIITECVGDFSELFLKKQIALVIPYKKITNKETGYTNLKFEKQKNNLRESYKEFVVEYKQEYLDNYVKKISELSELSK